MLCAELENLIGYKFKDPKLLETAMTHSSYANDYLGGIGQSNERLEFLGDALLDAVVGEILYERFPNRDEGVLTKLRADVVCEKALGTAALKLGLNEYLRLGKGEEQKGGRNKLSIVSDCVEALIAAVYLDDNNQSLKEIRRLIETILGDTIELACSGKLQLDSKTTLQEKCQAKGITDIKYQIVDESGPDHNKTFTAEVLVNGVVRGSGVGKTKKEAEGEAARRALEGMEE